MDADQFDVRLREVEAITGSPMATELFNQGYGALLDDVKALPGPKFRQLEQMQRLLFRQWMFLCRRWREEKDGIREIMQ